VRRSTTKAQVCAKRLTDPCYPQRYADLMLYLLELMANGTIE
jgi:hypothetical protein